MPRLQTTSKFLTRWKNLPRSKAYELTQHYSLTVCSQYTAAANKTIPSRQLRVGSNNIYTKGQKQRFYIFFVHLVVNSTKDLIENISEVGTLSLLQKTYVRFEAPL